jgi:hypothetical protein
VVVMVVSCLPRKAGIAFDGQEDRNRPPWSMCSQTQKCGLVHGDEKSPPDQGGLIDMGPCLSQRI